MDFKALRAAKNKKAQSMIESSGGKVDSSTFTPAEKLNADAKTGMRPISRRAFKVGGKVEGVTAKSNLSRTPRMNGGKIGLANTDQKTANEERDGVKHVGGFKKGGMVKNFEGSAKDKMQDKKLAGNRKMTMPEWEASKADAKHDKQQSMKNLKKSPRIGKALGGSFTPLQMQQMQGVGFPPEAMAQMQAQQAQQQQMQQMGQMQPQGGQQMTMPPGAMPAPSRTPNLDAMKLQYGSPSNGGMPPPKPTQAEQMARNQQAQQRMQQAQQQQQQMGQTNVNPMRPPQQAQPMGMQYKSPSNGGMPQMPTGTGGMTPGNDNFRTTGYDPRAIAIANGGGPGSIPNMFGPGGMSPPDQTGMYLRSQQAQQGMMGQRPGMMGDNQRNKLDDKNQRDDRQRPMNPMRPPQQAQPMGMQKAGGFKSGGKVAEAHVKGCMCKACGGSAGYKDGGGLVAQGERMKNGSTGALDARDSKMADRTARMEERNSDKTAKREKKYLERNSRDAAKIVKKEGQDTAREQAQAVRQKPMGGGQQRPMPMGGNQRPMGGGQSPVPVVALAPRNIAQPMATRVPRPAAIGMGKPTPPNRTAPVRTADGVGDGTGSGGMGFIKKAPKKPYTGATGFKAGGSTEKAHVKGCMCKACGGSAGMKDGGGLYANINAKRERIENGSNEKMRKVGSKGAPDAQDFRDSAKTAKKEDGGRIARATGGRTKGTTNISINVMPHNANNPENGIDSQMPPPMMPPAGGPPPMAPPPPPMGGGVPPGLGDAMAGAAGLPPAGGIDPMMGRKSGGKVYPKMQYGSGGGKGRLEKIDEYGKNA